VSGIGWRLQLGVATVATGGRLRASDSAERRFGVVLKARAELGLSVPGSAEPPTFISDLADG
jgi:hypothetical protein